LDYLDRALGDLGEDFLFESDLFTETWSQSNLVELNKSLEMAMGNRFDVESPDSGVEMNNFDFDIEGCNALIGVNDPIFNNFNSDIGEEVKATSNPEVISLDLPVITSENYEGLNDFAAAMESDDNEEEEEENEENLSINKSVEEIHSYSIIKIKKTKDMKFKKKPSIFKDRLTSTRRHLISINKKPKLYEMEPLNDPVAEKNRLNALNAKKNRDRKKQQLQEAVEEIDRLKEENEDLRSEAEQARDELANAKRELEALRQELKLRGGENASFLGNISPLVVV